jgi:uncharacterized protein YbcI
VVECLRASLHVGFFLRHAGTSLVTFKATRDGTITMEKQKRKRTMAQQVAQAASDFQQQRTGHAPKAVTVVLSEGTLVITLHGALSPAESALAQTAAGAAQVREFHQQLFTSAADSLREEIRKITGVPVQEAIAEIETTTGTVVQVFTSGTMVQVFQMAQNISAEGWSGTIPALP